jgi:hypothetical protein
MDVEEYRNKMFQIKQLEFTHEFKHITFNAPGLVVSNPGLSYYSLSFHLAAEFVYSLHIPSNSSFNSNLLFSLHSDLVYVHSLDGALVYSARASAYCTLNDHMYYCNRKTITALKLSNLSTRVYPLSLIHI